MDLTPIEVNIFQWLTVITWLVIYIGACAEAWDQWQRNKHRYERARYRGRQPQLSIARGRNRRSRNFFWGFTVGAFTGLAAFFRLTLQTTGILPQPAHDNSVIGVLLTLLIIVMGFFFWRAKHADAVTAREADEYAELQLSHEEARERLKDE